MTACRYVKNGRQKTKNEFGPRLGIQQNAPLRDIEGSIFMYQSFVLIIYFVICIEKYKECFTHGSIKLAIVRCSAPCSKIAPIVPFCSSTHSDTAYLSSLTVLVLLLDMTNYACKAQDAL